MNNVGRIRKQVGWISALAVFFLVELGAQGESGDRESWQGPEALSDDFDEIAGNGGPGELTQAMNRYLTEQGRGWNVLNPEDTTWTVADGELRFEPAARSLWFNDRSAALLWKRLSGNFKVTSHVLVRTRSMPVRPPAPPFRLGGLMARNPDDTNGENYVFIVLGADGNDLSVETKSTVDSRSEFDGPPWPDAEGDLRICRIGRMFHLYVRESGGPWQLQTTFDRPDLPDALQVGPMGYANVNPADVRITFEAVRFASVASLADCTQ